MLRICLLLACSALPSQLGALGAMIECAPCNERAMSACHPPRGCELVRESGCGCCLTCALAEGAACGVYTESCASGLRCVPRSGDKAPLQALLHGRGMCRSLKRRNQVQLTGKPLDGEEKYSMANRDHGGKNQGMRLANPSQHLAAKPHRGNRHSKPTVVNPSKLPAVSTPMADSEYCKPSRGRKRGHCWCVDKYGHSLPGPVRRKKPVSCGQSASSEEVAY
ncbi:insulin-like growth factor-binding protein 6b isoform X2 [Scyliorhinus torazame]|uniref:insulin-like growth factor-binding protein 6b isoform X2 n=1 Tax=Scyliorhinus torazame TaxID=75743 RepID=UPI003B5967C7